MGVGSYLSRYFQKNLLSWFIRFEILLSLVGGLSTLALYMAFSLTPYFYAVAFVLIGILGSLIGLEIPILTRIVRKYESLKDAMAKVLSFDYLGALIASVIFPLVLLPALGVMRTAFVVGLLNLTVAFLNIWLFREELPNYKRLFSVSGGIAIALIVGLIYSFELTGFFEQFLYRDQIMLSRQSAYQQIVVTRWNKDTRLFIDGNLQFSSRDEYRYHEPLTHLPMALAMSHEKILILGGGDGMAARELLKYPQVKEIEIVDLDPVMTDLGQNHPVFKQLNGDALNENRVRTFNLDAFKYIEESSDLYDVVIIDLPDPNNVSLGKLYSAEFYMLLKKRMAAGGVIITQSTSPYFAPKAFWCIHATMTSIFPETLALTTYVPSFGQWGFNISINPPGKIRSASDDDEVFVQQAVSTIQKNLPPITYKYLSVEVIPSLFQFDGDTEEQPVEINRLNNQVLVKYYEDSWAEW